MSFFEDNRCAQDETRMIGLELEHAFSFLAESRSGFVRAAADWLQYFDDPIDLLFALTGRTGQALGPWETFRFCALLGLTPHTAVAELAQDVLSEPLSLRFDAAPIAQAFAVAHAADCYPALNTHTAGALVDVLTRHLIEKTPETPFIAAALVAIAKVTGDTHAQAIGRCSALLADEQNLGIAPAMLEAAVLAGEHNLCALALDALAREQREDGGAASLYEHQILRGYVTLRAIALQLRLARKK